MHPDLLLCLLQLNAQHEAAKKKKQKKQKKQLFNFHTKFAFPLFTVATVIATNMHTIESLLMNLSSLPNNVISLFCTKFC